MGDLVVERTVHYLGSWQAAMVDNNILSTLNSRIGHEKGSKVKLHLTSDGLRIFKKSAINGKVLFDRYVPLNNVKFVSVSRQMPDVLVVISMTSDQQYKYQIQAFRCKNGMDAGIFLSAFGNMQTSVKVALKTQTNPTEEELNWTLNNEKKDNSKHELNKSVDVHGDTVVVRNISADPVPERRTLIVANGHTEGSGNGIQIPSQQNPTRVNRNSLSPSEFRDNSSEISESALRIGLESLSQELRDIKLLLEKSTGTTVANSKPRSPRNSTQYNVKTKQYDEALDAVIIEDEPVQIKPKENSYTEAIGDATTHVRVLVPDYRAPSKRSTMHIIKSSGPEKKNDWALYHHQKTMPYEKWKRNSIEPKAIQYNDQPERIQWKTRTTRSARHVVGRPSSTVSTWSTDRSDGAQVQVRHHPGVIGPDYQHVSFGPRTVKMQDRRTRGRPFSTTVVKPIEEVYTGRSDAKHHSLSSRSHISEVRPTILVQDNIANEESNIIFEHNKNVVKADNDKQFLDVSGIDVYKTVPTEGVTILT